MHFGPYRQPRYRIGQVVECERRGEVRIIAVSDASPSCASTTGRQDASRATAHGQIATALSDSLFYKTRNGAAVGDLYMSLIYTCQLSGANPFEYLTELQRHADQVAAAPAAWLPWNYRANLPATE